MKVIIAGASGMIGHLILQGCLHDESVKEIISLVRKPSNFKSKKLKEVVIKDFADYGTQAQLFEQADAAFFCIGVYTGQVPDEQFKVITVDYALSFAKALADHAPKARLCFLSGNGADRTEKSRVAFARYKGMAENQIANLGISFHSFRPAYIYPVTPRKEPNFMYTFSRWLYPLIKLFGENMSIKSTELAKSMLQVALHGTDKTILENKDILAVLKS